MMQRWERAWLFTLLLLGACAAPVADVPTDAPPPVENTVAPGDPQACVTDYDPAVDYFPDKARPDFATGWEVQYFNHYKQVTVNTPWSGAAEPFRYVLVQCGTPIPDDIGDAVVVEVPVQSFITMSTTQLPHVVSLGLRDQLVGVNSLQFVSTPAVREMRDDLVEVGNGAAVDVEQVLALAPDLVLTNALGDPQNDAHPQLLAAGVPVAIDADYLESSPLGQAEWIKFMALFFNEEAEAAAIFDGVAREYTQLAALTATVDERPTVFVNTPFQGTWNVPAGESYVAQLLRDAGGDYLWSDTAGTGSIPLDFEAVLARASDADYWLNTGMWMSIEDARAEDPRYTEFAPLTTGRTYNNNARLTPEGGNDYFETGAARPDLILADMIAILHPDLLPNHDLYFYRQLEE